MNISTMISALLTESESFGVVTLSPTFTQTDNPHKEPVAVNAEKPEQKDVVQEEIKLSPKAGRRLLVTHIAEQMISESVEEDEDLEKHGLLTEGKLTEKGKEWIKKFLPTIYAS